MLPLPPPFQPLVPVNLQQLFNGDANLRVISDDILREIFCRVDNPKHLFRCLLACKRFFRVISTLCKSFFLGFYHCPNPHARLPAYIHTEPDLLNPHLNLGFLHPSAEVHYKMLESRSGRVLLLKMMHVPNLHFVLANPFDQSCLSIEPIPPPLFKAGKHSLIICSYVPLTSQPNGEFKIIVVFSDKKDGCEFTTMAFCSQTHTWTTHQHDANNGVVFPKRSYQEGLEPTIYADRMLYKLQKCDYILAAEPSTLQLSNIELPICECDRDILLYGNHCIGRTEEGSLCFFYLRSFSLYIWVLNNNQNTGPEWIPKDLVNLCYLINPGLRRELQNMRFSAEIHDQFRGFSLATLNGFGEDTGMLILVLRDFVVSLDVGRKKMKFLWHSDDLATRVQMVYPFEMEWPPYVLPALQDFERPPYVLPALQEPDGLVQNEILDQEGQEN